MVIILFGSARTPSLCALFLAGWFILVGMGAILALVTAGLVWIDTKYGGNSGSSEHYATAGRSIKAGECMHCIILRASVLQPHWLCTTCHVLIL